MAVVEFMELFPCRMNGKREDGLMFSLEYVLLLRFIVEGFTVQG